MTDPYETLQRAIGAHHAALKALASARRHKDRCQSELNRAMEEYLREESAPTNATANLNRSKQKKAAG